MHDGKMHSKYGERGGAAQTLHLRKVNLKSSSSGIPVVNLFIQSFTIGRRGAIGLRQSSD
jgi:hypothetical protein